MNAACVPGQTLRESDRAGLVAVLGGAVRFDEPMAAKTSMRVGGPAAAFAIVKTVRELAAVLSLCSQQRIAWTVLGLGSNVLVRDEGFPGLVIRLAGDFVKIRISGTTLHAGGAAPMVAVCREAAKAGLAGAEALVGIPGTVGGAVRMNAGTNVEIGSLVRSVEVIVAGQDAQTMTLPDFTYRRSSLDRAAVVCSAELALRRGNRSEVQASLRAYIKRRNATQPLELPNAGSIFRNPPGDFAARLIETSGCKGMRVGGAEVSDKHANFIVNRSGATCADVLALMVRVRDAVRSRHGIDLEPEVQVL
jgi:UDP-N-acetylmuramate dehydrogenase